MKMRDETNHKNRNEVYFEVRDTEVQVENK